MTRTKRVVVFGGTGFLGRRLVSRLLDRNNLVTTASRQSSTDAKDVEPRLVQVDIRDKSSLTQALEGAYAAVNCVGLYHETRTESFHDIHVVGAGNIAEAVRDFGVERFIHISGIGVNPKSTSSYIRARTEGEYVVRSILPEAVILRPSAMFSQDGAFFGILDTIVRYMPVIPIFGDDSTRLQPVYVGDVAEAICRTIEDEKSAGIMFELGGAEIFSYREILERLAARSGQRRLFLPVPFALWSALARLASILPHPPITLAQVELLRNDNVVHGGAATLTDLGIEPHSATEMGLV
ncbi:MAG: complex I NDUFA9 subunit family protein [Paracoccaceae bacterium]|jgi:NADH dehydrogenase